MRKKTWVIFASILLTAVCLSTAVFASNAEEKEHSVTLTIYYRNDGISIAGAEFYVYKVADLDAYGNLTVADQFLLYQETVSGLSCLSGIKTESEWLSLAYTLSNVVQNGIVPDFQGKTDESGFLKADGLMPGLYLVCGEQTTVGSYVYTVDPFFVFLQNGDEMTGVLAEPKSSKKPIPGENDTVSRKVLKIWEDDGQEDMRPQEVLIQLLSDGKIYDTVVLNEKNNWRYTWNNLSDQHVWSVTEANIPDGYKMKTDVIGATFTVTNTYSPDEPPPIQPEKPDNPNPSDYPDEPEKPDDSGKLPQTGLLWWPVPILMLFGLLFLVVGTVRSKKEKS